ncbi:MAG: formate dehydrogenase accessory sulfurtransferase FdhD, partial [Thermoprotei archaeon]|nr:formate dehydrogenase accessory sulfurtransferase FdhD [Thermoprotei archaeon]
SYEAVLKARKHSITLIGFARGNRFNVYSEPYRLVGLEEVELG